MAVGPLGLQLAALQADEAERQGEVGLQLVVGRRADVAGRVEHARGAEDRHAVDGVLDEVVAVGEHAHDALEVALIGRLQQPVLLRHEVRIAGQHASRARRGPEVRGGHEG